MILVSVITAVYNAEDTILDCMTSIHSQVNCDIEHIIIDGESTDNTLEKIRAFQLNNPRAKINCITESDSGIYDAMNKGLKLAKGEIVGILNADDYYSSENVINKVITVFENTNVDSVYGDLVYVDSIKLNRIVRYWRSGSFNKRKYYWGWMPPHPTFFVLRDVYIKFGYFNLNLGSAADYELMLRFLVKRKISTSYINDVLVHMRTGGVSNSSIRARFSANIMDRKAWSVNDLTPLPWTLYLKPLRKVFQYLVRKK